MPQTSAAHSRAGNTGLNDHTDGVRTTVGLSRHGRPWGARVAGSGVGGAAGTLATTLSWHSCTPRVRGAGGLFEAGSVGQQSGGWERGSGGGAGRDADGVEEDVEGGADVAALGLEALVFSGQGWRAVLELPLVLHRLVLPVSPRASAQRFVRPALHSTRAPTCPRTHVHHHTIELHALACARPCPRTHTHAYRIG